MKLIWIPLGLLGVFVVLYIISSMRTASDRRAGILPHAGKATMADVERLVRDGRKIDAIRCYREIHQCGLAEAKKAVEDLPINP
jgi:ribosomal protein L7/L12